MATSAKASVVTDIRVGVGEWLRFPDSVLAPNPSDPSKLCMLRLSHADTCKAAIAGRRQPAFDLWSMVVVCAPPVPGVDFRNRDVSGKLVSLSGAHACFRGIERPLAEDDDGRDVLAYVLRPHFFYEYDPNMVSVASKIPVPRGLVFVVYVRLTESRGLDQSGMVGTITHWSFVEADANDPKLPVNHASRYRARLW